MSVIIHGMNMPTRGVRTLEIFPDGFVCDRRGNKLGTVVPLPEGHGRLGDLDAVTKTICNSCDGACDVVQCDCLNCKADCRCDIVKEISDAPTIVPAEGGTDDGN